MILNIEKFINELRKLESVEINTKVVTQLTAAINKYGKNILVDCTIEKDSKGNLVQIHVDYIFPVV